MTLRPGSFLWLVRHDLLLSSRKFSQHFVGRSRMMVWTIIALGVVFMHGLCRPTADLFARQDAQTQASTLAGAVLFMFLWQVSQAITRFTRLLYSRGDLDLLLASPVSRRAALGAHAVATAVEITLVVGGFVFPMADMLAWRMGAYWLAVYPALVASALLASASGFALTVGLFNLLGPRHTRAAAQVTATLIAASMILGGQFVYLFGSPARPADALLHARPTAPAFMDWLIQTPMRGVTGDLASLILWMALGGLAFAWTVLRLGPGFLQGAILVRGLGDGQLRAREKAQKPFRPGASAALRRKELQLLARDPWLFSRGLLQLLYLAPVCIVIWISKEEASLALLVAPLVIMVLSHLAGILAWLTILSEDAPDFITTAPVTSREVLRHKLEAIFLPLGLILLAPTLGLAWTEPLNALLMVLFAIAACASAALINIWHPAPARAESATSRHNPPKIVGLKENVVAVCWAVACVGAVGRDKYWIYATLAGLLFVWVNRPPRRARA